MTYSVSYLPIVAEKDIPKLPVTMRERIATAIEQRLTTDPLRYGKPLQFNLKGHRQLRVGDYRIIYRISEDMVIVSAIKHRKDVYED